MLQRSLGKLALVILSIFVSYSSKAQNQALDLSGTGNEVNVTYNLTTGPGFTVEQWIYIPTISAGASLVNQSSAQYAAPLDAYVVADGSVNLLLGNGTASFASVSSAPGTITPATWHHIALVYDPASSGSEGQIFIDGVSTPAATVAEPAGFANVGPVRIGRRADLFEGDDIYIDEVRIWSVARSGAQINSDYNQQLLGNEAGLDVYLRFENDLDDDAFVNLFQDGSLAAGSINYISGPTIQLNNYALDFDGTDDEVIAPANANFDFASGTVEFWFSVNTDDNANNAVVALRDGTAALTRWSFHVNTFSNTIGMYNGTAFQSVPASIDPNIWYHVAFNIDGTDTEVFLDGISLGSTGHGMSGNTGRPLSIGSPNDITNFPTEYFPGKVDEVRLWNSQRSVSQINAFKNVELNPLHPGLVGYFDFSDGPNTSTLSDLKGGGPGLLTNMDPANDWITATHGITAAGPLDTTNPTVTITSSESNPTIANPIPITVTFDEEVVGFDLSDIVVGNGTPSNLNTADNIVFTADITPSAGGDVFVDIFSATLTDLTGNFNDPAPTFSITYDLTPPMSIAATLSADRSRIYVEFDEGIYGAPDGSTPVDVGDFDVTVTGGTATVTVNSMNVLSPAEIEFLITINGVPDGAEVVDISPFATSVYDAVGNIMSTTQSGNKTSLVDNSALSFDGIDDYVIVANDAAFELQQYTIEAWVNFPNGATPVNDELYTIVSKGSLSSDGGIDQSGYNLTYGNNGGTIGLLLGQQSSGGTEFFLHPITLNSDTWYHLAGTYDGSTMRLFVDGLEVAQHTPGATDIDHAGDHLDLKIGAFEGTNFGDTQKGLMDEVRIWDFARGASTINSEKDFILTGSETGLVAYYDFNDASGGSASEIVGALSGTLTNMDLSGATGNWASGGPIVSIAPPPPPTDLIAYATSTTAITLEWTDNATDETGYNVERDISPVFGSPLVVGNGLPADTQSFVDNAGVDQRFYYRVIPTNGNEDTTSYSATEFGSTIAFAGDALAFDGIDDRVSIADNDSLSFGNGLSDSPFAVEAWINLDQVNSQGIVSKRSGTNEWHMATSGSGQLSITLADNSASAFLFGETTGFTFQTGEWYHVAFSYNGNGLASGIRLFIDGIEYANNPSSSGSYTAMENTNSPLEIGTINSGTSFNFDGQIDELKIWRFEKIDYSDRFSQPQGNEPNLIAYYSMDEGSGLDVLDGSVNTNDGMLQNGPVFNPSTVVQDGVVSNTNDDGPGSLRAAINYANANSPTTIAFNIPGGGPYSIAVTTTLPDITAAGTIIDGTTQPGWTFGDVNNMVSVNGSGIGSNSSGFNINEAANVEIYGMIITGFSGLTSHAAIELTGDGADNVNIGAPGMGNIIHGGGTTGIYITNSDSTVIQGNWIGTLNGTTPSGNNHHGISATGTVDDLTIGGNSLIGEGNIISGAGNGRYGITTSITGTNLSIRGNLIGTDSTGNVSMNNEAGGIDVGGAVTFVIGGVGPGERNIISGNNTDTNADGINIGNSPTGSILNNYIGVGENGSTPLGNGGYGILFANSASNVLVDGNIISNNGTDGLYLGNGSSTLTVSNNLIGLTSDGLDTLGNANDGIRITNGTNITISGNTISANGSDGIAINGDQTNLDINANIIGLDINGVGDMILSGDGVTVTSDNTFGNQANGIVLNLVDGASAGNSIMGNLISGNGVFADQNSGSVGIGIYINADTRGFTIQDNVIGLAGDEITPQKNINSGIYISGLSNSVIGGVGANEANLIGHNGDYGIEKLGTHMNGVSIHGNEFDCNEKGGISFTSTPDIDAPIINLVSPSYISGTTTAEDNTNIFIYEADSCNIDQGRLLVADSINVVSGGTWTVNGSFQLGKYYVAIVEDDETAVNATLSTSEFSMPDSIPASVVTNTNDSGSGSLRDAIAFANANPGTAITFDIPGGGPWVIGLATALPQITANNTIIDGTTQPGWTFADTTAMVQINGSGIGSNAHGINIDADQAEVYGLILTGFLGSSLNGTINLASASAGNAQIGASGKGNIIHGTGGNGIYIQGADSIFIQGNWIGTSVGSDTSGVGNHGIATAGTSDNLTIGGDFFTGEGNVISGSGASRYGINIFNGTTIVISGNYIGTNANADAAIANGLGGISIGGSAADVTIGGPSPGDLNIISGNIGDGIRVQAGNDININGNYIGIQSDGSSALGNGQNGIQIESAPANINIGDINQNIISENIGDGIFFNSNLSSNTALGANIFSCNQGGGIGYGSAPLIDQPLIDNITATSAIVSSTSGDGSSVTLWLSQDGCSNDQGLTQVGFGTVASGEAVVSGIFVSGQHYTAYVEDINGTSEFASPFVPNFVAVTNENDTGAGSLRAAIDSVNVSPGKAIYFNIPSSAPWEINLASDLPDITAQGTIIDGTTQPGWNIAAGDIPQIIGGGSQTIGLNFTANLFEVYGLHIRDFTAQGIRFNAVGTTADGYIIGAPDKGNIITGNSSAGVFILTYVGGGTVQSNYIGIMPDGTTAGMGNQNGISLGTNGDRVQIGGLSSDEMNVISNNTTAEISISNADSTIIQGNLLGLDPLETTAFGAGNGINMTPGNGVLIEGNVISGHTTGIRFNNSSGNIVRGNAIGLASDASTPFPNTNGIHMINNLNSDNNIIGSANNSGDANYIGENTTNAILIEGSGNNGNQIQRNSIFNNGAGITLNSGAHNGIIPPVIDPIVSFDSISGSGTNGDIIDLYLADGNGHGESYLGSATVSGGIWNVGSLSLTSGEEVVATATNSSDGTSEFSTAAQYLIPYPAAEGAGEALTFDGIDDFVELPTIDVSSLNAITVEAWIKPNDIPNGPGNQYATIVGKGSYGAAGTNSFSLYLFGSDGSPFSELRGRIDNGSTVQEVTYDANNFNTGEWVHVALSWNSGDPVNLYVNGELVDSSAPITGPLNSIGDTIRIGSSTHGGELLFEGEIDEVKIWDSEVSEDGMRQYLARKVTNAHPDFANLLAYYRMDDSGDALNLQDFKGIHNGTINGGSSYTLSGAHLGDDSYYEYVYSAGSGRDLGSFRVQNLGTANLPLHIYRINQTPSINTVSGFDNIDDPEYYGVFAPNQTYDANDTISGLTSDRRIMYRADGADPTWTSISGPIGTDIEDEQIYAYGQMGSGQFTTAIDQNPYPTPVDAGHAMSFDGVADYITVPHSPSIDFSGNFTVEAWINPDGSASAQGIVSKFNSEMVLWLDASTLRYEIGGGAQANCGTIPSGEWTHVALTYDGSNARVYVNGILVYTNPEAQPSTSTRNVFIGSWDQNEFATRNFVGDIDEVRIWDIQLSETNIRDHMIGKMDADFDSLNRMVSYFRFDENSAVTATNIAGDGDGTITGATPVISGAPQGQGSLYSYAGTPGVLNTAQFGEDINIYFDDATNGIHGYLVGGAPNQVQANGFDNLDQGKYFGVFAPGGQKVDIRMDYNGGIDANRRIVYRKDASDTSTVSGWERLSGLINTSTVSDSVFAYAVPAGEVSTAVLNPPSTYPVLGDTDPGTALDFDGSTQYVQLPAISINPAVDNFTVELWARPTALGGTDNLFVQEDGTGTGRAYLYLTGNTLASLLGGSTIQSGSPTVVNNDTWYHFAVTYDGVNVTTYINGLQEAQAAVSPESTDGGFRIGSSKTGASTLTGDIDEVRIWKAALSPSELSNFANTTDISTHPNYADMLAYYKFDDGIGSTILEDVFANNDGALTGMDENTDWVASGALASSTEQNALDFDGTDDYVDIGQNVFGGAYTGSFTVEAWVYSDLVGNNNAPMGSGIFKNMESGSGAIGDLALTINNSGQIGLLNWRVASTDATGHSLTNDSIPTNTWTHVAATWDGATNRIYINGVEQALSVSGTSSGWGAGYGIGRVHTATQWHYDGQMDEVRVWQVARSETDINDNLYNELDPGSETDLVAYYQFNETGGTALPDLKGSNDGTWSGAAGSNATPNWIPSDAFTIPSAPQNALNFDGTDDYVSFNRSSFPSGFTYEAWVKTSSTANTTGYNGNPALTVIGDHDNGIRGAFGIHDGKVRYTHWTGVSTFYDLIDGFVNVNDDQWHHIAVTHEGDSVKIYVDGILDISTFSTTYHTTMSADRIGSSYLDGSGNAEFFDGEIDEVRIWDVALNEQSIRDNMYAGDLTPAPQYGNLVVHYGFDQGVAGDDNSGLTTANDQSSNAFDGTLNNFTLNGASSNFVSSGIFSHSPVPPSTQAVNLVITNVTDTTADVSWTNGDGQRRLVVVHDGTGNGFPAPPDNVFGNAGDYGFGDDIDGGWFVVYNGYFNNTTIKGLTPGTDYEVAVLEVNGPPTYEMYNINSDVDNPNGFTTTGGAISNFALDFDGINDHAQVASPTGFPVGAAPRTLEFWFKSNVDLSSDTDHGIVQYGTSANDQMFGLITTLNAPGRLYFFGFANDLGGITNLVQDQWYHAAVTYDGTNINLYLDGNLEATKTATLNTVIDGNGLTIGRRPDNGNQWDGQLDEIRLWDHARSQTDIQNNMNNELLGNEAGLVAYYPLSDGTGSTTVTDETGGTNGANLVSMDANTDWVEGPALSAPTVPDATLTTIDVPGIPIDAASNDNLVYKFSVTASGGNLTKQGFQFGISGDATSADFSAAGWKIHESVNVDEADPLNAGFVNATEIGEFIADTVIFTLSGDILSGDTHYFYVLVDVDAAATIGNSFNIALMTDPVESFGIVEPKNKIDGGFIDGNSFTIQSSVDVTQPNVSNLAPSINTITDSDAVFDLTVTFDEAMDTGIDPTFSFPVEDPSNTLTFSGGIWDDNLNFTASFNVTDANETLANIDIQVTDAQDVAGNLMNTFDAMDVFTIDTENPIITVDVYGTSITSPELNGTIDDSGAAIDIEVDGANYAAVNNGDGTWTLGAGAIASLTDATYDVVATATDNAGNTGTDSTSDELIISQTVVTLAPTNVTSTGFTARWSQGLDVLTYQIDVSDVADFSTFVPGFQGLQTGATGIVVSNLDFATQYYYRVRLVNSQSQVSANSNTTQVKTAIDPETQADSLALVQIFNAIAPQGLNWPSARLRNWDGVTLDISRTRVEVVDISGTGAAGNMPNPFTGNALANGGLSNMLEMNASDNQITGLMDYSGTAITSLNVSTNNLEFDDLEPVAGISSVDYSNQASVQFNESAGAPIEVRYTNDYSLSISTGGSSNVYTWFRNDVQISSSADFIVNNATSVILAIDYDNMGTFRTEVTNPLVPGLTIDIDPQDVLAIADMQVSVTDANEDPLSAPLNGFMLETTRTATGFRVLETLENVNTSTFTFPDVVLGNYIILVESDLGQYIPTYFGNVFEWTEADTLFFRSDDVIDITMTEVPPELTAADGEGLLDVLIEEDFGDDGGRIDARRRASKRKCGLRRKRSGGRTGQDDDEFELIAYGETDDNGEFQFGFLPQGIYRFFVEYPGIPLDESSFVQFEVGEAGVSDTDFRLQAFATEDGVEVTIEAVLGIILEYFKDLEIYPNPSSDYLNIRYRHLKSGDITAQLVDLSGKTKWSEDLRDGFDGQLRIDVADFEEGMYILRFYDRESPQDNVVSFRVIVKN